MLFEITENLKRFLIAAIPNSPDWVVNTTIGQDENAPAAPTLPPDKLLLFLYAVGQDPHLRNRPHELRGDDFVRPPMGLTLRYLILYNSSNADQCQKRLAQVLQAFYEHPLLGPPQLDPALASRVRHLRVRLHSVTNEELNQVWTALNMSMRLSLHYEVDAALVDPGADGTGAVLERTVGYVNGTA